MKVIYTGFSKCGTKSMAAALRHLGLNVHDFMQQYEYNGADWTKMCEEGLHADEIRKMLEGVDAVTDIPANGLWEQILEAYPDAKVCFICKMFVYFKMFVFVKLKNKKKKQS